MSVMDISIHSVDQEAYVLNHYHLYMIKIRRYISMMQEKIKHLFNYVLVIHVNIGKYTSIEVR